MWRWNVKKIRFLNVHACTEKEIKNNILILKVQLKQICNLLKTPIIKLILIFLKVRGEGEEMELRVRNRLQWFRNAQSNTFFSFL